MWGIPDGVSTSRLSASCNEVRQKGAANRVTGKHPTGVLTGVLKTARALKQKNSINIGNLYSVNILSHSFKFSVGVFNHTWRVFNRSFPFSFKEYLQAIGFLIKLTNPKTGTSSKNSIE